MRSKLVTSDREIFPFSGLDTLNPPDQLDNGFSPALLNVQHTKGTLQKRKGYGLVGDGNTDLTDPVIGVIEFEALNGTRTLVGITTKKQFKFNTSTQQWDDITLQTAMVDVDWTGGLDDVLDFVSARGLDKDGNVVKWLIITNGKDKPRYWDGSGLFKDFTTQCDLPNLTTFGTIEYNSGHLIIADITLSSTGNDSVHLAWSDAGSLANFTTNTSGEAIVSDSIGPIKKLINLADRCIIYSQDSIIMMSYIAGDLIFSFERVAQQIRLVSARAIVDVGPYHLYMSAENIYLFDGNRVSRPVADRVQTQYREQLFVDNRDQAFAFLDLAKNQVYFNVPTGTATSVLYVLEYDVYNLDNLKWSIHQYSHPVYSMGFFSRDLSLKWNSASLADVTWGGANFSWKQASIRSGFPARVFGSNGVVYLHDDTSTNDAGVAYKAFWDTKDFTVLPDRASPMPEMESLFSRWLEIETVAKGYEVQLFISTDMGRSYQFVQRLDLDGNPTLYRIPLDYVSRTFRIRLVNECLNSSFDIRQVRVHMRKGGAH